MVRMLGPQVNLGNVAPGEALGLATLRTGLRGDTFREMHLHGLEIFLGEGVHGALEARERGGVIVVIDALRASATMIAALEAGMAAIRPVASPEECSGEVTAGERGGRKLPNCRHNSSPTELMRYSYPGKTLVLTSTNGVECLLSAAGPKSIVLVGSTLNRRAVAGAAEGSRASAACRSRSSWRGGTTSTRSRTRSPPARSRARCRKRGCTVSSRRRRQWKPISSPALQAAA